MASIFDINRQPEARDSVSTRELVETLLWLDISKLPDTIRADLQSVLEDFFRDLRTRKGLSSEQVRQLYFSDQRKQLFDNPKLDAPARVEGKAYLPATRLVNKNRFLGFLEGEFAKLDASDKSDPKIIALAIVLSDIISGSIYPDAYLANPLAEFSDVGRETILRNLNAFELLSPFLGAKTTSARTSQTYRDLLKRSADLMITD